jgi:3',5'-cyclic AMP phosphodiesterase CpdA
MALKIGVVTDIHNGPDMDTRIGSQAIPMLDRFVTAMRRFQPDVIIDLGDRINDVSVAEDRARIQAVRDRLASVGVPVLFLYGNHDLINVKADEQRRILGKKGDYESLDVKGFHLILLNSQDPTFDGVGGTISDAQLAWLQEDLHSSQGPILVFCHHPLNEQDSSGHWYFGDHQAYALAVNRERARELLERSGRVRAIFHGHMHWNHVSVNNGMAYVTVESLICNGLTGGPPAGCFAEVVAEPQGVLRVEVKGALPMTFVYS